MLYSRLGDSGLIVSRLSLGTMTFTRGGGLKAIAKTDLKDAAALVDHALAAGITFIDPAAVYSDFESEEMLGTIVAGRRAALVLATPAGWRPGASRFFLVSGSTDPAPRSMSPAGSGW